MRNKKKVVTAFLLLCTSPVLTDVFSEMPGDVELPIASAQASQLQPGEGIERTYDKDISTLYHSPYSGTGFPVELTYHFQQPSHVDYLVYTPRQGGGMISVLISWISLKRPACCVRSMPILRITVPTGLRLMNP